MRHLFDGDEQLLVNGTLRGYRYWNIGVEPDQLHLASIGVRHTWATDGEHALCLRHGQPMTCTCATHNAPHHDCTCGIYGWYDPDDDRAMLGMIFGVIEVTGRVIMGSHGFRAEHATVLGITPRATTPTEHDLKLRAALTLNHPVYPSRAALLEAFPPQDVSNLIDHDCDSTCDPSAFGMPSPAAVAAFTAALATSLPATRTAFRQFGWAMNTAIRAFRQRQQP